MLSAEQQQHLVRRLVAALHDHAPPALVEDAARNVTMGFTGGDHGEDTAQLVRATLAKRLDDDVDLDGMTAAVLAEYAQTVSAAGSLLSLAPWLMALGVDARLACATAGLVARERLGGAA